MERGRQGPTIGRRRVGLRPEQGNLEGGSLRRWKSAEGLVDDPFEEISRAANESLASDSVGRDESVR